jgi:hypothetical protein
LAKNRFDDELSITKRVKSKTILEVGKTLVEAYIYPDVARKIRDCLKANLKRGVYDEIDNAWKFALEVNKVFIEISNDKHLHFLYDPLGAKDIVAMQNPSEDEKKLVQAQRVRAERQANFGVHEIKILEGNIGYLDLRRFCHTDNAGETAVAAMSFLANSDAIIIDLRENGGGEPEMVQLLSSYFLKGRTQLTYVRRRSGVKIEQYWTIPHVPGKRLLEKDLYLLTSNQTFSAAEDFAYGLKCIGRAKIIGETTRGGAHLTDPLPFQGKFILYLPTGKALNPISGENWEAVGVKPDVTTSAEDALDTAHRMALENLIGKANDESEIAWLQLALDELRAKLCPVEIDEGRLQSYVGVYGKRRISLSEGVLYFESEICPKRKLTPLTEDLFVFEGAGKGLDSVRMRFIKDNDTGKMEIHFFYKRTREIICSEKISG